MSDMQDPSWRGPGGLSREDFAADLLLDEQMDAALVRAPEVQLPEDFAARIAARVRPLPAESKTRAQYGYAVRLGCGALLAVVLIGLIVAGAGQQPHWLLYLLSLELALLALGGGAWRHILRWPV